MLPKQSVFAPSITIKLVDKKTFGHKPVLGTHEIKNLSKYIKSIETIMPSIETSMTECSKNVAYFDLTESIIKVSKKNNDRNNNNFDWWSKYYASIDDKSSSVEYLKKGYDKITVNSSFSLL